MREATATTIELKTGKRAKNVDVEQNRTANGYPLPSQWYNLQCPCPRTWHTKTELHDKSASKGGCFEQFRPRDVLISF